MKKIIVPFLLLGIAGLACWSLLSCGDDDDDNNDSGGIGILDSQNSECKGSSGAQIATEESPQDLLFDYAEGILSVTHVNADLNCCMQHVVTTVELTKDVIHIEEEEDFSDCWCTCLFDIVTRIANLAPGTYTVEAWVNGALAISEATTIPE